MKKILFLLLLATAIALVSFTKLIAEKHKTFTTVPFNDQSSFLIESDSWSDCTGEWIHVIGNIHIDVHGVMNGNKINFVQHINYQGLSGEGQTSGRHYAGSGVFNNIYNGKFDGSSYTTISTSSIKLNAAGSGNNLVFTSKSKITVNASGEVTVSRFDDLMTCR
jgi:hypothetical protein